MDYQLSAPPYNADDILTQLRREISQKGGDVNSAVLPYSQGNFICNALTATIEGNQEDGGGWALSKTVFEDHRHNPNSDQISNFKYTLHNRGGANDDSDTEDDEEEKQKKFCSRISKDKWKGMYFFREQGKKIEFEETNILKFSPTSRKLCFNVEGSGKHNQFGRFELKGLLQVDNNTRRKGNIWYIRIYDNEKDPQGFRLNENSRRSDNSSVTSSKGGRPRGKGGRPKKVIAAPTISTHHNQVSVFNEKFCHGVVENLLANNDTETWFFSDPRSYPGYVEKVKRPMWFLRVQQKLQNRQYQDLEGFFLDICLIFRNAKNFNGPSTMAYKHADKQLKKINGFMEKASSEFGALFGDLFWRNLDSLTSGSGSGSGLGLGLDQPVAQTVTPSAPSVQSLLTGSTAPVAMQGNINNSYNEYRNVGGNTEEKDTEIKMLKKKLEERDMVKKECVKKISAILTDHVIGEEEIQIMDQDSFVQVLQREINHFLIKEDGEGETELDLDAGDFKDFVGIYDTLLKALMTKHKSVLQENKRLMQEQAKSQENQLQRIDSVIDREPEYGSDYDIQNHHNNNTTNNMMVDNHNNKRKADGTFSFDMPAPLAKKSHGMGNIDNPESDGGPVSLNKNESSIYVNQSEWGRSDSISATANGNVQQDPAFQKLLLDHEQKQQQEREKYEQEEKRRQEQAAAKAKEESLIEKQKREQWDRRNEQILAQGQIRKKNENEEEERRIEELRRQNDAISAPLGAGPNLSQSHAHDSEYESLMNTVRK